MKSLSGLVPSHEFVDVTDEIPGPDGPEFQPLPPQPAGSTVVVPNLRIWRTIHRSSPLGLGAPSSAPFPGLGSAPGRAQGHLDLTKHTLLNLLVWTYEPRMFQSQFTSMRMMPKLTMSLSLPSENFRQCHISMNLRPKDFVGLTTTSSLSNNLSLMPHKRPKRWMPFQTLHHSMKKRSQWAGDKQSHAVKCLLPGGKMVLAGEDR